MPLSIIKQISQRTAKVSLILNIILIVVSISLFVFAVVQRIEADQRRIDAQMQSEIALEQLERAEYSLLQADSAAMLALEQAYRIKVLEDSIAIMKKAK